MRKEKPKFITQYDMGDAMSTPVRLPGGRRFFFRLILWTSAIVLLIYAFFGEKFIKAMGNLMIASAKLENETDPDPEIAIQMFADMAAAFWPFMFLMILVWIIFASAETAFHKNLFRGTDEGLFPLRFGKEELRVMLAQLCVSLILLAVYVIGIIAIIILSILVISASGITPIFGVFVGLFALFGIGYFVFKLIQFAIRLAPAAAMTVRDGHLRVFEAWETVKGRSWPVFGSFFIVYLCGYILLQVIIGIGTVVAFGNDELYSVLLGMTPDDPEALFRDLSEKIKETRVLIPLVVTVSVYTIATYAWMTFMWGISNYIVQTDERVIAE